MKFIIILLAVVYITVASAQRSRCRRPERESCAAPRNMGRSGPDCRAMEVWWYNYSESECQRMQYRGCGGNGNRFCSKRECQNRCRDENEEA